MEGPDQLCMHVALPAYCPVHTVFEFTNYTMTEYKGSRVPCLLLRFWRMQAARTCAGGWRDLACGTGKDLQLGVEKLVAGVSDLRQPRHLHVVDTSACRGGNTINMGMQIRTEVCNLYT